MQFYSVLNTGLCKYKIHETDLKIVSKIAKINSYWICLKKLYWILLKKIRIEFAKKIRIEFAKRIRIEFAKKNRIEFAKKIRIGIAIKFVLELYEFSYNK